MNVKNYTPVYFRDEELASELIALIGRNYVLAANQGLIIAEKKSTAPWLNTDPISTYHG